MDTDMASGGTQTTNIPVAFGGNMKHASQQGPPHGVWTVTDSLFRMLSLLFLTRKILQLTSWLYETIVGSCM